MSRRLSLILLVVLAPAVASAQGLTYTDPSTVFGPAPPGYYLAYPGGTPVDVAHSYFAVNGSTSDLNVAPPFGYVSLGDVLAASASATNQSVAEIQSGINNQVRALRGGIAAAASVNVLPPNPGDRFSVSFGAAEFNGSGAGSASASYRVSDRTLAYVAYARGDNADMVKGGVGFSFH